MHIRNLRIRPLVSVILLILVIFLFQPGSAIGASVVSTDKHTYNYGEVIKVDFSNAPGKDSDWICIAPSDSPDTEAGDYKYMPNGLSNGTLSFTAPIPGRYEVRAYYDYNKNGYKVSGRCKFSVAITPEGEAAIRKQKTQTGEDVVPISDTNNCQFIKTAYFEVSHPSKIHDYAKLNTTRAGGDSYKIVYSGEERVFGLIIIKTNIAVYKCKKEPEKMRLQDNSAVKTKQIDNVERLRELKKLKDEGLLTDQEYEQKRKAIVDGI